MALRVVYVSTLERGGPLAHLLDLAPAVSAAGADVRVLCSTAAVASRFRAAGIEALAVELRHKLDLRGAARLWPLLEHADVVHTHDRRAGLLARPQGRLRRAIAVHTLHGMPEEIAPLVGRDAAPRPPGVSKARIAWLLHGYLRIEALLSSLGHVVVPSQAMARFAAEHGLAARRLHVIPYGIRVARREPGPPGSPVRVGTAANLEYWKGVDVLLEACALSGTRFTLDVFGEGGERGRLERRAAELGLDARFWGYVPGYRERLLELDLFVLPSRADNLPVSILEAMAAAVPVVATSVGGIPELVADGVTGLLVEPERPAALADAIDALVADPDRRAELGRAGARRVAELFDGDEIARRVHRLYEELCGSST